MPQIPDSQIRPKTFDFGDSIINADAWLANPRVRLADFEPNAAACGQPRGARLVSSSFGKVGRAGRVLVQASGLVGVKIKCFEAAAQLAPRQPQHARRGGNIAVSLLKGRLIQVSFDTLKCHCIQRPVTAFSGGRL